MDGGTSGGAPEKQMSHSPDDAWNGEAGSFSKRGFAQELFFSRTSSTGCALPADDGGSGMAFRSPYKRLSVDVSSNIQENANIIKPLTRLGSDSKPAVIPEPSLDDLELLGCNENPFRGMHRRSISDSCLIDTASFEALIDENEQREQQSESASNLDDEDDELYELDDEDDDDDDDDLEQGPLFVPAHTKLGPRGSQNALLVGAMSAGNPRPFMRSRSMDVVSKTRVDIRESVVQKLVTVKTVVDTQMKTLLHSTKQNSNFTAAEEEAFRKVEALVEEIAEQPAFNLTSAASHQYVKKFVSLQASGLSDVVSKCLVHFTRITRLVEFRDVGSNVTEEDTEIDFGHHNFHTIHSPPRGPAASARDRSFTHTSIEGQAAAPATLVGIERDRMKANRGNVKSALRETVSKYRERRGSKEAAEIEKKKLIEIEDIQTLAERSFTAPLPRSALFSAADDPFELRTASQMAFPIPTTEQAVTEDFKELQFDEPAIFSSKHTSANVSAASSFSDVPHIMSLVNDDDHTIAPERDGAISKASSGMATSEDDHDEDDNGELLCRICEELVPSEYLIEHSEHCVEANKADMRAATHDQKLYNYYQWVERRISSCRGGRPAASKSNSVSPLPTAGTTLRSETISPTPTPQKSKPLKVPSPIIIPETPSGSVLAALNDGDMSNSPPNTAKMGVMMTFSPTAVAKEAFERTKDHAFALRESARAMRDDMILPVRQRALEAVPGSRRRVQSNAGGSVKHVNVGSLTSNILGSKGGYAIPGSSKRPPAGPVTFAPSTLSFVPQSARAPNANRRFSGDFSKVEDAPLLPPMPLTARPFRFNSSDSTGSADNRPLRIGSQDSTGSDSRLFRMSSGDPPEVPQISFGSPNKSFDFLSSIPLKSSSGPPVSAPGSGNSHTGFDGGPEQLELTKEMILDETMNILADALRNSNHLINDNDVREQHLEIAVKLTDQMKDVALKAEINRLDKNIIEPLQRIVREMNGKVIAMRSAHESRVKRDANKSKRRSLASNNGSEDGQAGSVNPEMPPTQTSSIPNIDDFESLKPIKKGAFGSVYLCRKKKTGDLYAIKMLKKSDLLRKNKARYVRAERNILASVNNPFVVKMYYAFQNDEKLFFVMEFLNGGDCYSLLKHLGYLDEEMAKVYIAETVLALEYLHSCEIIHRDVKPDNMLISSEGHIKLTDFGLSHFGNVKRNEELDPLNMSAVGLSPPSTVLDPENILTSDSAMSLNNMSLGEPASPAKQPRSQRGSKRQEQTNVVGTPDYLAPEILYGYGHGYEVDWWALGVILYEFLTGLPPFAGDTPEAVFENILAHRMEWPPVPEEMSPEAQDIISKLLNPDPDKRLGHNGAAEIKAHPFFSNIDWDNLYDLESPFIPFIPQVDDDIDTGYFVGGEVNHGINSGQPSFSSSIGEADDVMNDPNQMSFPGFSYKNVGNLEEINKLKTSRRTSQSGQRSSVGVASDIASLEDEEVDDDALSDDMLMLHG